MLWIGHASTLGPYNGRASCARTFQTLFGGWQSQIHRVPQDRRSSQRLWRFVVRILSSPFRYSRDFPRTIGGVNSPSWSMLNMKPGISPSSSCYVFLGDLYLCMSGYGFKVRALRSNLARRVRIMFLPLWMAIWHHLAPTTCPKFWWLIHVNSRYITMIIITIPHFRWCERLPTF